MYNDPCDEHTAKVDCYAVQMYRWQIGLVLMDAL